jgi:uncharacterized membrane protein YgdD (TMEM256/DUF423 family)|tara:strand:+ start:1085 stop:1459 length:375 start_codon:yes stop_codon:yes gene_type:complete
MRNDVNESIRAAAILGFLGVAIGAFGAHLFEDRLIAMDRVDTWETAVLYHLIHSVGLLALGGLGVRASLVRFTRHAWIVGIVIFSGSLYILSLTGIGWLGAITPIGGLAFLAGWLWLLRIALWD